MQEKIKNYIKKYNMLKNGDKIVLGVSGGQDSVFLFHMMLNLGYKLEVVHVNHCIRGEEAIRDQEFVRELCRVNNVNFHLYTYDIPKMSKEKHLSEELIGRNCRRIAFEEVLAKTDAKCIALAHHENDRTETLLFNISRGAGINGLTSIKPVNGLYIRPLLAITRQEIEKYISENNIDYVEDSTNNECEYTRNKIRHNVIPELENVNNKAVDNINRTIDNLMEISQFLNDECEKAYTDCVVSYKNGLQVNKNLLNYNIVIQKNIIRKVIEEVHGDLVNIYEKHILVTLDLFNHGNGKYLCLPKGVVAEKVKKNIYIYQK